MKKISIAFLLLLLIGLSQYRAKATCMETDRRDIKMDTALRANLIINDGVTYIVTRNLTLGAADTIKIYDGGTLIVDGGTIQNACFQLMSGSLLIVKNNGSIYMASGKTLEAPVGALVNIEYGTIN